MRYLILSTMLLFSCGDKKTEKAVFPTASLLQKYPKTEPLFIATDETYSTECIKPEGSEHLGCELFTSAFYLFEGSKAFSFAPHGSDIIYAGDPFYWSNEKIIYYNESPLNKVLIFTYDSEKKAFFDEEGKYYYKQ